MIVMSSSRYIRDMSLKLEHCLTHFPRLGDLRGLLARPPDGLLYRKSRLGLVAAEARRIFDRAAPRRIKTPTLSATN